MQIGAGAGYLYRSSLGSGNVREESAAPSASRPCVPGLPNRFYQSVNLGSKAKNKCVRVYFSYQRRKAEEELLTNDKRCPADLGLDSVYMNQQGLAAHGLRARPRRVWVPVCRNVCALLCECPCMHVCRCVCARMCTALTRHVQHALPPSLCHPHLTVDLVLSR